MQMYRMILKNVNILMRVPLRYNFNVSIYSPSLSTDFWNLLQVIKNVNTAMGVSLLEKSSTDIKVTTWGRFQCIHKDGEQVVTLNTYHKASIQNRVG